MKHFKHTLLLLAAAVLGSVSIFAQNAVTPYSMYGYGILNDNATSMQRQMGGVGVAMRSGRQINVMNPASYAAIDSLTFLWDMGADMSVLWSKEGSAREHAIGGGLDYLTMQFPLGKHMGGSVGMLPYTSVGYAFGNKIEHGTTQYNGSGGINKAYLGLSGAYAGASLGVNVSYNFGNIVNDDYSYPVSSGRSLFEHVMQIRDWDLTVGAQYQKRFKRFHRLTAGVTFSPKKSIHGNSWCTIQELSLTSTPDTVASLKLSNNYYMPNTINAGINYQYDRTSHIMVEVDFLYQDWANAKYSSLTDKNGQTVFQGMKFNNRWRAAAGAEIIPKMRGNYGERITYRLGAYYNNDYLNILGNGVKEYGVTCGFGLPTPEGKTMINVGLEWKHRTSSPVVLIQENYLNITIGINFNETWFWQRKIK